jgi:hypothetical protein
VPTQLHLGTHKLQCHVGVDCLNCRLLSEEDVSHLVDVDISGCGEKAVAEPIRQSMFNVTHNVRFKS